MNSSVQRSENSGSAFRVLHCRYPRDARDETKPVPKNNPAPLLPFSVSPRLRGEAFAFDFSVMTTGAIEPGRRFLFLFQAQRSPLDFSDGDFGVLAMTLQAPAHGQRRELFDGCHLFHRPMALLTGHARQHMLTMIEINEIRQVMDLHPGDG